MAKPVATLGRMPPHILQHIVDSTDAISRFSLRKCSRVIRNIVDNSSVHYHSVTLCISDDGSISLELTPHEGMHFHQSRKTTIKYHPHAEGCVIRNGEREKFFKGNDPMEMAVSDFSTIFINPKVHVIDLNLKIQDHCRPDPPQEVIVNGTVLLLKIQDRLSKLNRKLDTDTLLIFIPTSVDLHMKLLSCFIPGTLSTLSVQLCKGHGDVSALTSSEHWKQAKRLFYTADNCPVTEMTHFEHVRIFVKFVVSLEDVKMFVRMATDLGDNFEFIGLHGVELENPSAIKRYLHQYRTQWANEWRVVRPDSDNFIKITWIRDNFQLISRYFAVEEAMQRGH